MTEAEETERRLIRELNDALSTLPNIPGDDVPLGEDESGNVEIRRIGNQRNFSFTPKEHYELGEALGYMDFERAAKLQVHVLPFSKAHLRVLSVRLVSSCWISTPLSTATWKPCRR